MSLSREGGMDVLKPGSYPFRIEVKVFTRHCAFSLNYSTPVDAGVRSELIADEPGSTFFGSCTSRSRYLAECKKPDIFLITGKFLLRYSDT